MGRDIRLASHSLAQLKYASSAKITGKPASLLASGFTDEFTRILQIAPKWSWCLAIKAVNNYVVHSD